MDRDPFTRDLIAAHLDAAAVQMFDVLRKTAMSPIIYEVLDVGTGITDAEGALVSSGAGIPSFIGVLDKSVRAIRDKMGDTIAPGDVFVTNDPNHGGVTHLNDVVLAEPVFHAGQCVAWVASIAHWGDIGGRTPGSMSTAATDLVSEGLRLPIVRLFAGGVRNAAVFDIIATNSRLPDFALGDLWAQVSAGRSAADQIRGLCQRHGTAVVDAAIAHARHIGTRRAADGLAALPKGRFDIARPQDDGSQWRAAITIDETRFEVDLRDAPPQTSGPYNTGRDGAVVAAQVLFKALTDPDRFANAGSFAPLTVLTTPGTVFHADPQAAHGYYFETRMRLIDMLWQCMARAMPGRLPAGHFATIFGTVIAGRHADTGRGYAMVEPQMGGWGATATRPGQHAMFSTNHGDTFMCPAEIAEARYGLEVVERALVFGPDPDRADGHPGGAGVRLRYRMRAPATLSAGFSHAVVPVWSDPGLPPGGCNRLDVTDAAGRTTALSQVSGHALTPRDVVCVTTAHGGAARATGSD